MWVNRLFFLRDIEMKTKLKKFYKIRRNSTVLCKAPFVSMSLDISGFISPCCYIHSQTEYLNNNKDRYPDKSLNEIWAGKNFATYRNLMKKHIFPEECSICRNSIISEQYDTVKINEYDCYSHRSKYPSIIELTLDNSCNLECVMCSSIHSSRISHRDHAGFKTEIVSSKFIEEFDEFIPTLKSVIFSGGEPFLSRISLDLMDRILTRNPECIISVNTNGTILNEEIKSLLSRGVFHLNISLDSINKETYEKIRVGAVFEKVLDNLKYFSEYSKKRHEQIVIPVCPLVLNYKEIPELVKFCNENSFLIKFVHVFNAHNVALSSAKPEVLQSAIDIFKTVELVETNFIEKANKKSFLDFTEEIRSFLSFSLKKTEYLNSVKVDMDSFLLMSNELDSKIKQYIVANYPENIDEKFNIWQLRKNELFLKLPDYFKSHDIFQMLLDFDASTLIVYFDQLPLSELINYMITFGDEIIMKRK